jgi:hypothetical protein
MALENRSKPRQLVYLILVAIGFVSLVTYVVATH